jgi:hypothetical protein
MASNAIASNLKVLIWPNPGLTTETNPAKRCKTRISSFLPWNSLLDAVRGRRFELLHRFIQND